MMMNLQNVVGKLQLLGVCVHGQTVNLVPCSPPMAVFPVGIKV